ncbi:MAG: hypothetical protein KKG09_08215 [Verrucomicrobia bacterium]|nr:hypothetical protein [Verrucomicrobiota bacterium]MCG2680983.1 hypothetical protein [Kiritimatiellia bacterium]MBU4248153.1 hypothetical protein [Verrucomicrobiota bacterium]MBU4290290.1 hypothetical protein [Verrucomicrobiota bacterium]MBU4429193.1 hypothetical protein [Verrucomicrobiota bacterium]
MRVKTMLVLTAAMAALVINGPGAWAATYTGGAGDCSILGTMTNDVLLGDSVITLSSAADQSFASGYAPVAISAITITDDPATPVIKSGTNMVVWIPAGFVMTWDEADLTPTFGGTAAGKVGAISYTNSNQRLKIAVTADFSAGDTLTISALAFKNYLGSGSARLELDYDNDGIADVQDDKTITILGFHSYGGLGDSYALDQMITDGGLFLPAGTFIWTR